MTREECEERKRRLDEQLRASAYEPDRGSLYRIL